MKLSSNNKSKHFRLRSGKKKPEIETVPLISKESPQKNFTDKTPAKPVVDENLPKAEPTMPCRIPFTGMFPLTDVKV